MAPIQNKYLHNPPLDAEYFHICGSFASVCNVHIEENNKFWNKITMSFEDGQEILFSGENRHGLVFRTLLRLLQVKTGKHFAFMPLNRRKDGSLEYAFFYLDAAEVDPLHNENYILEHQQVDPNGFFLTMRNNTICGTLDVVADQLGLRIDDIYWWSELEKYTKGV